jgi:hypothetical protein
LYGFSVEYKKSRKSEHKDNPLLHGASPNRALPYSAHFTSLPRELLTQLSSHPTARSTLSGAVLSAATKIHNNSNVNANAIHTAAMRRTSNKKCGRRLLIRISIAPL